MARKERSYVLIRVVVEHTAKVTSGDVAHVIDRVLDAGTLQEAVASYAHDVRCQDMTVVQTDRVDDPETESTPGEA